MVKGNIYMVQWIDTFNKDTGWENKEEIKENAKYMRENLVTIGFYLGEMWGYEAFAQNFNKNRNMKNWSGVTYIPKGCIKKIDRLK